MKIYFLVAFLLILTAFNIGWVLPFLFSARDWILVILGVVDVLLYFPMLFFWIRSIVRNVKKVLPAEVTEK